MHCLLNTCDSRIVYLQNVYRPAAGKGEKTKYWLCDILKDAIGVTRGHHGFIGRECWRILEKYKDWIGCIEFITDAQFHEIQQTNSEELRAQHKGLHLARLANWKKYIPVLYECLSTINSTKKEKTESLVARYESMAEKLLQLSRTCTIRPTVYDHFLCVHVGALLKEYGVLGIYGTQASEHFNKYFKKAFLRHTALEQDSAWHTFKFALLQGMGKM